MAQTVRMRSLDRVLHYGDELRTEGQVQAERLARLGSEYAAARINDTQYIAAAKAYGLTHEQALDRCLRADDARAQYRAERRDLLHRVRSARYAKRFMDLRVGMDGLFFWQRALVTLRRAYHGKAADAASGE